jgi:hypothetical protein
VEYYDVPSRVFFSYSFASNDEDVAIAVSRVFERPDLREFEPNVRDARALRASRVESKITDEIAQADIVVAIFTRKHRIEGTDTFAPPAYVIAEAAFALARHKRLLLMKEDGVPASEMGLIDATGLEWLPFQRTSIHSREFSDRAAEYIRSALEAQAMRVQAPHTYGPVVLDYSVYPNGYATNLFHYDVTINRPDSIVHELGVGVGLGVRLPSEEEFVANSEARDWPIPHTPFATVASETPGIRLTPYPSDAELTRRFRIEIPADVRKLRYSFLYGMYDWRPDVELSWFKYMASRRGITSVDLRLRIHRAIQNRLPPRVDVLIASVDLEHDTDKLRRLYDAAKLPMQAAAPEPLFQTYRITLADFPSGADVLLFY